ncbi:MAG: hypothetical protein OQK19_04345 [Sedimenticola sp.]|uniref:Uncharacterized protein n=1 Tax=Sedimenticola thiotaurini TaxID=1543721 RepID=A0A558DCU8_9GAMM|nr:hypothetical protein [Sedimenticola sp.]MCW8921226.1 hypothetical protein [Sedimenticola sp.]MCW8948674.1 hypothetical protein [Sedimenticola sp.]MCW8976364.1 hypothetical protein [Sedimenticola sp.]TVT58855.1 MAG: hypothetical protein FHK82_03560 [Sedimenticola thiotaurini]
MNTRQMDLKIRRVFARGRLTKQMVFLCTSLLFCGQASAYDGWSSELSHATGGAIFAGGVTYLADRYTEHKENRAWIGFGVSSILFTVVELSTQGSSYSNRLDIASHVIGSAVGAFATDKWILKPVVKRENAVSSYFGVETKLTF